jgi:hypothetical protein
MMVFIHLSYGAMHMLNVIGKKKHPLMWVLLSS